MRPIYSALTLFALTSALLSAQDTRNVTEPRFPPICIELKAQLVGASTGIAEADESKLDTDRIQKAIDSCGKGKAVALQVHGASNAFLSGPLELREGVTLVVDKGATLFETLDPAVMETAPGSCGIVATGRRPRLQAPHLRHHVSGAGVMGDGAIDGRGGENILGKTSAPGISAEQAQQRRQPAGLPPHRLQTTPTTSPSIASLSGTPPTSTSSYNGGDGFTVWGVKIDTSAAYRSRIRSPATPTASTPAAAPRTSPSPIATSARATTTSPSRGAAPASSPR